MFVIASGIQLIPHPSFQCGHFKWPEILHADVSWPPSELIRFWSSSVDFPHFCGILTSWNRPNLWFPDIFLPSQGRNGMKSGMLTYSDNRQCSLDFDRVLLIFLILASFWLSENGKFGGSGIFFRMHGRNCLKFDMLMYPDRLWSWLHFGHNLLIFLILAVRGGGGVSLTTVWDFSSWNWVLESSFASVYETPNRTLILIFWYQKMIFWYQKLISDISFWYQKMCEFLISENHFLISGNQFLISENDFLISEIIFWYQKLFSDIRKCHDFLISEIIFWYQKLFSEIRNSDFLISENDFWYQKIEFLISENYFLISENRHQSPIWRSISVPSIDKIIWLF